MNIVCISGRLTSDPKVFSGNTKVAKYTLAVDRVKEGTDFINCVTFGKTADFVESYLKKGTKVIVEGRIQTGSYEKDGPKISTVDVVVNSHEFAESKKNGFEDSGYSPF